LLLAWPFKVGIGHLLWALLAWPFVDNVAPGGILAPGAAQELVAGMLVAGLAATLFGGVFPRHAGRVLNPLRYLWFLIYVPVFAVACVLANLDVAYRVLHLRLTIRPGIVKVRTSLKSEMGKLILAHSIALIPGTLVVDMVGQEMYVHWINVSTDSAELRSELILGNFEWLLKKVFD
jgi:multicomponent Na+:H+ antiporter subunit E